ncbi:MAG: hypothetical protein RLZZ347_83 [Candidatus Parcubacteria bacterium]|jgi:type III secretory pathway component EscU
MTKNKTKENEEMLKALADYGKISQEAWSIQKDKSLTQLDVIKLRFENRINTLDYLLDFFKNLLTIVLTGLIGSFAVTNSVEIIELRFYLCWLGAVLLVTVYLLFLRRKSTVQLMLSMIESSFENIQFLHDGRLSEIESRKKIFTDTILGK